MIRNFLTVLVVLSLTLVPAFAAVSTSCSISPAVAPQLSAIARQAAEIQKYSEEMQAYLRNTNPHRLTVASYLSAMEENLKGLRTAIAEFESHGWTLNDRQQAEFDRLKAGLETMTVFLRNSYRATGSNLTGPGRDELLRGARAITARSNVVLNAARTLRQAS